MVFEILHGQLTVENLPLQEVSGEKGPLNDFEGPEQVL